MAILLADIGGTNARFRWSKNGKLGPLFDYKCDDFKAPLDVVNQALKDFPNKLNGIVLAGAGPVQKKALTWTNRPKWKISEKELQKKYHIRKAVVVNDLQAQGEGLKMLYKCTETTILMTAGTGLGGCFITNGQVIPGEIGQVRTEDGRKKEDTISGFGIVRLYHSFGGDRKIKSARKIEALRDEKDIPAQKAFKTFYQEWGKLSARLATALYAKGGIYLWGGLIPKREPDKKVLMNAYKNTLPKTFQKIPLRLVKDKALSFKGLTSLSHREFGRSLK